MGYRRSNYLGGAARRASLQRWASRLRRRSSFQQLWKRQRRNAPGVDGRASAAAGGSDLWPHRGEDRRHDRADWPGSGSQDGRGGSSRLEGWHVIGPTGAVRVLVATKPVDFRKGAEGLAALVRETMRADPFSGAVYVFRAKRADRVKLIYWDGTGVCLFAKRLEDGKFRWPS